MLARVVVAINSHLEANRYDHYDAAVKSIAPGILPAVTIDRAAAKPLYRQLCDAYRQAIVERRLRGGQRLPSTRAPGRSAPHLAHSGPERIRAVDRGRLLRSRRGSGTFVASAISRMRLPKGLGGSRIVKRPGPRVVARRSATLLRSSPEPWLGGFGAFRLSEPALDHFPTTVWSRLIARHSRNTARGAMTYGSPMGSLPFREAVADYLRTPRDGSARRADPGGQRLPAGARGARVLLEPGHGLVEEPGYSGARDAFAMAGRLIPVPVDDEGLDVAAGMARAPGARGLRHALAPVPAGMTMSARGACSSSNGRAQRRLDHRGRLRQRVPLREPADQCAPGARSRRAGALCRDFQQGALSRLADWLTVVSARSGAGILRGARRCGLFPRPCIRPC